MPSFRPKPPLVRPAWGRPILQAQSCWFVANDSGPPRDILQHALAAASLGVGVTIGNSAWGKGWNGSGASTAFINLGSTNRFIDSDTTPFTISWVEHHTGANTNAGVVNLFAAGGAHAFAILRLNQSGISSSTYGHLAVGPWNTSGVLPSFLAPPSLTDNQPHVFVVTGLAGPASQTPSDWTAYWEGGQETSSAGGNTANLGATQNYFGWDNADNKFDGVLDNLRIWNRVLSASEVRRVLADPYVGCVRNTNFIAEVRFSGAVPHALSGNVKAGGINVVGATVWLLDAAGALLLTTTTDASGNYAFSSVVLSTSQLYEVVVVGPSGDDFSIHGKLTPG